MAGKGLTDPMHIPPLIGVLRDTIERQPAAVLDAMNRAIAGQLDGGFAEAGERKRILCASAALAPVNSSRANCRPLPRLVRTC